MYFFPGLVFFSDFLLEGLGTYVSVLGLASGSAILIGIAVSLDLAKLVTATALYKYWKRIPIAFRIYMLPALVFLMVITSYGTYGFLTREFGKSMSQQVKLTTNIKSMEEEKLKLENRKKDLDDQIKQLPSEQVTQRKKLNELFAPELNRINDRIVVLDKDIPLAKLAIVENEDHMGTVGSIAKSWGSTPDEIIKVLSLLIVCVIDPMAIVLLTVGNLLIDLRQEDLEKQKLKAKQEKKEDDLEEIRKQQLLNDFNSKKINLETVEKTILEKNENTVNANVDEVANSSQSEISTETNVQKIVEESIEHDSQEQKQKAVIEEDIDVDAMMMAEEHQQEILRQVEQDLSTELINLVEEKKDLEDKKPNKKLSVASIINKSHKGSAINDAGVSNIDDIFINYDMTQNEVESIVGQSQVNTDPTVIVSPSNNQKS
jgi:hypothetical protein